MKDILYGIKIILLSLLAGAVIGAVLGIAIAVGEIIITELTQL